MTGSRSRIGISIACLALGVALVAVAMALLRVPAEAADTGLELRIGALPNGELAVKPLGDAVRADDLRRGERARGFVTITNQTAESAPVRMRVGYDDHIGARSVRVAISDRGRTHYRGALARLRDPARVGGALAAGESRRLRIEAGIDPDAERGWRGAIVDAELELTIESKRR